MFAARGYHGTGVSELVAACGVARGTFYQYFPSKEAVFHALLDVLLARLSAALVPVDRRLGAAPVSVQLRAIVSGLLSVMDGDRALTRILFREALASDGAADARMAHFHRDLAAWVRHALSLGVADGILRPIDRDVVADCVVGTLRGVIVARIVDAAEPLDVERVADAVLGYAWEGLSARRA